ncbi:hypothetical protein MMC22_003391 [Lobaria immixta]|nr:hypothetical protein [Lobaria immixta]
MAYTWKPTFTSQGSSLPSLLPITRAPKYLTFLASTSNHTDPKCPSIVLYQTKRKSGNGTSGSRGNACHVRVGQAHRNIEPHEIS